MFFEISEIKRNYPDLYAFLVADATENLCSMAEHLNASYKIELTSKKVVLFSILEIVAITSTVAHFKTLIEIKRTKSDHEIITDQVLIKSFNAAVRCNQVKIACYLLETYPSVLTDSNRLQSAKEIAEKYKLNDMHEYLKTKTNAIEVLRSGEKAELPIEKSSTIDEQLAKLSFFNIGQYRHLDAFAMQETTLASLVKKHRIILPGSIEHVPNDGNCFFHAVSRELKRLSHKEIAHDVLRLQGVEYMQENRDEFEHFFCEGGTSDNETESLDDYLVRMTNSGGGDKSGAWADGSIITAIARQHNVHLYIYLIKESGEHYPIHYNQEQEDRPKPNHTIGLVLCQNHYYILKLDQPAYTEQLVDINHGAFSDFGVAERLSLYNKVKWTHDNQQSLIQWHIKHKPLIAATRDKAQQINQRVDAFSDSSQNVDAIIDRAKQNLKETNEEIVSAARATLLQVAAYLILQALSYNKYAYNVMQEIACAYCDALEELRLTCDENQSAFREQQADGSCKLYNKLMNIRDQYYKAYFDLSSVDAEKMVPTITIPYVSQTAESFFRSICDIQTGRFVSIEEAANARSLP